MGPDIDLKFHQEVMEMVSYDIINKYSENCLLHHTHFALVFSTRIHVFNICTLLHT